MDDNEEPIRVFIEESRENLERLDREVVALENHPTDQSLIGGVFRTLHTMKASCGFFDFHKLQAIAHAGENLLGTIREGKRTFTPRIGSVLLRMADRVRRCIDRIEKTGTEDSEDDSGLLRAMESALVETALIEPTQAAQEDEVGEEQSLFQAESSVRVNVEVLDRLMDLVGELVLVRNQLLQRIEEQRDSQVVRSVKQLNEITGRLQDGIMQTRMQPIRTIWNRFPRLVRDTASFCRKEVNLKLSGADTEIDRSVIEAIRDPLTHLIRNAIDHGIETPNERLACGKSRSGTIHLHAEYENGQVVLTVSDDGRGISPEKVLQKAIQKGMISQADAATLSPDEVIRLIFLPSFSTSESVTQVSGRGVGMDVVKTNIESIGGSIDIQSSPNEGSRFCLRIPLTLAIVQGLIVRASDERFVIPQTSLVEVVRLEGETKTRAIEMTDGTPILRLRGRLIPLVDLSKLLELEGSISILDREEVHVLILQFEADQIGMIVDEIFDTEEIVIKSLGGTLSTLKIYSGATILGDGMLALVIDVPGLASYAAIRTPHHEIQLPTRHERQTDLNQPTVSYVIVEESNRRFAIDLSEIRRLEPLPPDRIRPCLHGEVVTYRDTVLPIFRLSQLLSLDSPLKGNDFGSLLIIPDGEREIGLLVDRVIDIVQEKVASIDDQTRHPVGLYDGAITEFLPCGFWREKSRSRSHTKSLQVTPSHSKPKSGCSIGVTWCDLE